MAETYTRRVSIYIETGQALAAQEKLLANQDKLNTKLDELKQKQKEAADVMKSGSEESRKAFDKVTNEVIKQQAELNNLRQAQERATQAATKGGQLEMNLLSEITKQVNAKEKALNKLTQEQKKAGDAVLGTRDAAKKEYDRLTASIASNEGALSKNAEALDRVNKKISGELSPSGRDLKGVISSLRREIDLMSEEDPLYHLKKQQLAEAEQGLRAMQGPVKTLKDELKGMLTTAGGIAFGVLIAKTVEQATEKVMGYFSGIVTGSAKLADELTDIQKTTNLPTADIRELNKELKEIDTRTPTSELRALAAEAGKIGESSVSGVKSFVDQANQIAVALKEDLGEDAITQIGKAAKLYNQTMLELGSGINEIGNASEATEAYQVNFIFRMAGISKTARIAAGDVMGYGAALELAGVDAEKSSTAMQNFFIDFIKDSDKFGKAAGFAKGELGKLINDKGTNAAFIEFLKGMKATSTSTEDFLTKLEDLGIDGARGSSTFLALAENIGQVEKQQAIANKAIKEGTSITEEYNKRNNNFAAQLARISKEWSALTNSTTVLDFLTSGANLTLAFLRSLQKFPDALNENSNLLIGLATAVVVYNSAIIASTLQTGYNTAASWLNAAATTARNGLLYAGRAILLAYTVAQLLFTQQINLATAATLLFNTATAAVGGGLALLVAVIAAAGGAMAMYYNSARDAYKAQKLLAEVTLESSKSMAEDKSRLEALLLVARDETIAKEKRLAAIKELNRISPEYLANINLENVNTVEATKAVDEYIKSLGRKALAQAFDQKRTELNKRLLEEENKSIEDNIGAVDMLKDALNPFAEGNSLQLAGFKKKYNAIAEIKKEIAALDELYKAKIKAGDASVVTGSDGTIVEDKIVGGDTKETDKEKAAREKRERELEEYKKFREKLAAIERESEAAKNGADELEIQKLEEKYATIEAEAKRFHNKEVSTYLQLQEDLASIYKSYQDELSKLEDKHFANRTEKELAAQQKATEKYFQAERTALKGQYADGVLSKEQYDEAVEALDSRSKHVQMQNFMDYYEALKDAYKNDADKLEALEAQKVAFKAAAYDQDYQNHLNALNRKRANEVAQDNADVINATLSGDKGAIRNARLAQVEDTLAYELELYKGNQAKINEAEAKAAAARAEINKSALQQMGSDISNYGGQVVQVLSSLATIQNNIENAKLQQFQKQISSQIKSYDDMLNRREISQKAHDKAIDRLNKEMDAKKREIEIKQFKRNQAIQITQAIVNTAAAIVSALGTSGNIYAGIALAAMAGITGAAQVAVISSAEPPSYGEGTDELLLGPKHNSKHKGMPVIDPETGQIRARLEGEEAIIRADSAKANRPIIRALNAAKGKSIADSFGLGRQPMNAYRVMDNIYVTSSVKSGTTQAGSQQLPAGNVANTDSGVDRLITVMEKQHGELSELLKKQREIAFYKEKYDKFNDSLEVTFKRVNV